MRLRALPAFVTALSASLPGCDRLVRPDLDPSDYEISGVQYACRQWLPAPPTIQRGLFDIYWGRPVPQVADDGPTREHRLLVQLSGGVVVHEFNVRMIRAVMPVERIPDLGAIMVHGVPLAHAFPVDVFVRFKAAIVDDVIDSIEAAGGRIVNRFDAVGIIVAVVADEQISTLRRNPGVSDVHGVGPACGEDGELPPS